MILHILPPQWECPKVVDYMKPLYLNCELIPVAERFDFFSHKKWNGRILREGQRILVGEDPILWASKVSDLRTERDQSSGVQIVRWTQPPGIAPSSPKQHGEPVEKVFRIGADCDISELKQDQPRSPKMDPLC